MTSRLLIRNLVIGAILTGVAYFAFLGHSDTETGARSFRARRV